MTNMSVAEAARRLGVGVPRIHQRIVDGSLRAERVGSQWVVDELSLLHVAERNRPGRPLSARSAWAIIAAAEHDEEATAALAPIEHARARTRLDGLLSFALEAPGTEDGVRGIASILRRMFRNRSARELYRAAEADLARLHEDSRWESVLSSAASGIALSDVDGYLSASDVASLTRDFLLVSADADANVVLHVLPSEQKAYPRSRLRLAIDLAERRAPREELRAADLLRELAVANEEVCG